MSVFSPIKVDYYSFDGGPWATKDDVKQIVDSLSSYVPPVPPAPVIPAQSVRFSTFFSTAPQPVELLGMYTADKSTTFQANFSGSIGSVLTPPANNTSLDVLVNGAKIGIITITNTGSFSFSTTNGNSITLSTGQNIYIQAQSVVDSTINGCSINIVGVLNG